MKRISLILLIFTLFGFTSSAQQTGEIRRPLGEKAIPKILKATFNEKYPDAMVYGWYATHITYWYEDYSPGWYSNWYGPRQVIVYSYAEPAYYEVEFTTDPGEISRAIFNRYAYWFETRTKITALPLNVMNALKASKYGEWKWSLHKERIEAPGMPGSVYRLKVSKGMRSVIVRFDDLGNFIQAKEAEYMQDGDPDSSNEKKIKEKEKKKEKKKAIKNK